MSLEAYDIRGVGHMKSNATMHLPKEEREQLPSLSSLDFDLDAFLRDASTGESPESLKKDTLLECPECRERGEKSVIRPYQLNFHEAMYLCPSSSCSYPMKESRLIENFTFRREASAALDDDKKELYHQSSDNFDDIFNGLNDSFFDNPVDFSSSLGEADAIPVPVPDEETKSNGPTHAPAEGSDSDNIVLPSKSDNVTEVEQNKTQTGFDGMDVDTPQSSTSLHNTGDSIDPSANTGLTKKSSIPTPEPENHDVPKPATVCEDELTPIHSMASDDQPMDVVVDEPKDTVLEESTVLSKVIFSSSMIQWINRKNSCWLDSILQMAVTSDNIRAAVKTSESITKKVWNTLINTYDQSQKLLNEASADSMNALTHSLSARLSKARGAFLTELQKNAKQLKYGEFQSVLEMLPLSLKVDGCLETMFKVKLLYHFQCSNCPYQTARRSDGLIISMPNTLGHFHPLNAQFRRCCSECKSENASTTIWMEQLPPCIVFHFQNGLSHSNLRVLDFAFCGQLYCVFAVVQYITGDSRHFVTWIRDIKKDRWLRCDDLGKPICQWTPYQPNIPPHQIHMVFWERKHSDGTIMSSVALEAISNEEVIHLAESIPLEHFLAHNEETIVIQESAGSGASKNTVYEKQVYDTSQTEVCAKNSYGVTADNERSTPLHVGQNVTMHASSARNLGEIERNNASSQADPLASSAAGFTHTFIQPDSQLENAAMTMLPHGNDRQHIQIIAPQNTCGIYIVSQGGQTGQGQPFYLVPPTTKCIPTSFPTLPSFVDNPHSYNMVARGVDESLQNQTEKPKSQSKRMRRQFKLSGYSSRISTTKRYTPMQASKSYSSTKSADNACDAASVKSCNSKGDSETRSEISELSDMLPDFDSSGCSHKS